LATNMIEFDKDKFKRFWKLVAELSLKKDIFFNASAITFNLVICAIPFTLILISILGYILSIEAAFDELIRYGRELLPSFTFETQSGDIIEGGVTLENLIQPLVGARQLFGIVGLVILLIFAQGLFHTLKHVLFQVFEYEDRKHPAMELVHNFFAFGVIGGVFLFFSMAISIISLFSFDDIVIPYTEIVIELGWMADLFTNVIPIIFTPLLFYAIFRYISERRIHPKVALVGSLSYTLLLELAKYGVSIYLVYALTAYRYFYQGYTIIILIGLWVFYSAVLFVVTSILARAYQDVYLEPAPAIEKNPYTAIS
jgi:uncharacterized BrkB/YihY/UPF0761 family membrane protein